VRIIKGFPQSPQLPPAPRERGDRGAGATGRGFGAYPHLWITLWTTEPASSKAFSDKVPSAVHEFEELGEEEDCG